MKTIGLARLGKTAELRYLPSGEAVANLALAVNYGKRGEDGNRPTQWIEASMWGKAAETLAEFMVKGSLHCFTLSDIHIETYQTREGGTGHKLVARVDSVELGPRMDAPDGQQPAQRQPAPQRQAPAPQRNTYQDASEGRAPAPQPTRQAPPQNSSGFDDRD